MTRDISSIVDAELDAIAPPSPLSGPALAATGRRSIRRRRLAGILGGVALIAAASVLAATTLGGTPPVSPASDTQPSFPLPELDPSVTYDWGHYFDKATPETERLTAALWERLSALEDIEVFVSSDGGDPVAAENLADLPAITRADNHLFEDRPEGRWQTGHIEPVYEMYGRGEVLLTHDDLPQMRLLVQMYPKDGYLAVAPAGAEAGSVSMPVPYLQPNCAGLDDEVYAIAYECPQPSTEDGDRTFALQYHFADETADAGRYGLRVIRYFANGNALVLTLGGIVHFGDWEPVMSAEELTALALSLPAVPVI
ncbi:hypothetical protein [Phytomonospora endophytica]|uniref:Uncharacterized protein n=1 Tax=Phytomonospora endophytica TaxID=714109 RepID=A0A841FRF2_9ACTN|nr:hypothetical protein [Phytomonospora endophytica]MBB6036358.1 hypothetical protein [Phytomonospora endophytica]GIG67265.1 hypothetical protein Pen01_35600 [Phytomonospora endophytica]